MTNGTVDISPRTAARIAGVGYLVIIIAGLFAEFFVRSELIVRGNAAATAGNIIASEGLFRVGIAADTVMLVFDILVALALYVLLRPVNKDIALLAAFFRLVHAAVSGVNLLNMLFVLPLLGQTGYPVAFDPSQLHALALLFLNAHNYGYLIGLVFFGIHCLILGYLILKAGFIPKILGILMILASAGYLIDSFANFLLINYADYAAVFLAIVAVPAITAELSFCLWLLFQGGKVRP